MENTTQSHLAANQLPSEEQVEQAFAQQRDQANQEIEGAYKRMRRLTGALTTGAGVVTAIVTRVAFKQGVSLKGGLAAVGALATGFLTFKAGKSYFSDSKKFKQEMIDTVETRITEQRGAINQIRQQASAYTITPEESQQLAAQMQSPQNRQEQVMEQAAALAAAPHQR